MHIFLKKQIAVPIIIFCEWMPLKKPTRWVSEGCPLSTEWEVIERGFGGCARARGRIWRVSPGRVPPSKATLTGLFKYCFNLHVNYNIRHFVILPIYFYFQNLKINCVNFNNVELTASSATFILIPMTWLIHLLKNIINIINLFIF